MKLKYQEGFKYQTMEDFVEWTEVYPRRGIKTSFLELTTLGQLRIKEGYAWDGPSGPTIDTESFMRGSLVHDALYQLMRLGWLSQTWRKQADRELKRICKEDGMGWFRAWYILRAVRRFAAFAADPASRRVTLETP